MVVDDNPDIVSMLSMMLPRVVDNCQVVSANNGSQGLDLLKNMTPDVILTNWRMPQMDGMTFLSEVRQQSAWDEIRLVMMSALATPDVQDEASANGAEAFLSKPFTLVDLRLLFQGL